MTEETPGALYEVRGHIALITLNRPDAMNSVNRALSTALGEGLERAEDDPEVRVVVLTATGRAFCAGMDLKAFAKGEDVSAEGHPEWGFAGMVRHPINKPVIAAVNGFAMGGGTELVLASDLAVAAESAKFGLPEVKRGLVAAAGGVLRLPRQIPVRKAMELALTGRAVNATEAAELGLVNRVVPDAALLDAAFELAEEIAANAPLAVQATKQMIHEQARFGSDLDDEIWQHHDQVLLPVFRTKDAMEGAVAFAEKRAPAWRGE
ncbi:crotonase/enoyl-CoA hydratase family protein [Nocardioides alcanivorans]|uniref:crotonase/enoyl-CoA hydratase family protein n=1 Tax=Nocardioides alcanivorans TaxID=2897352 RepID=UPI001F350E6B|nr:crotonase/enoyl-CoA hydratase family protein [Nocardioides alcanivorans]